MCAEMLLYLRDDSNQRALQEFLICFQINLTVDEFKMLMMIVSANLQEGEKG